MGKNTLIKRFMTDNVSNIKPEAEQLIRDVVGNVGFVFTNSSLHTIRDKILSNRIRAPAKAGILSPADVVISAGNTGMEPSKTSFFQALGIPTKITKGTIEIVGDIELLKANAKVGASEATLLNMLGISPFTYGFSIVSIYDKGSIFSPQVLDINSEKVEKTLDDVVKNLTALSLQSSYPTKLSVTHIAAHAIKNMLTFSIGLKATDDPEASKEPVGKFEEMLRQKFKV